MISVRPDLNLADIDVPIVGMICAYLDGLPLAIELAAMRTKLFAPLALLARLVGRVMGSGLALLTTGARDMPARQQTMRSAIKWSYDLLPQAEQVLFRKLSMFPGWYTLEAVMAVYGAVGNTQNDGVSRAVVRDLRLAVLDGLAMLVNQSLVQCLEGEKGEPRFAMLRTLREYALELVLANSESRVMQIQLQQLASNRLCELVPGSTIFPA
jgi:non-specific serine/threonine protein kinase